jgi:hypothetical protein
MVRRLEWGVCAFIIPLPLLPVENDPVQPASAVAAFRVGAKVKSSQPERKSKNLGKMGNATNRFQGRPNWK